MRCALALLVVMCCASASMAQIVFEPVQYQYSACGRNFYYGGSDPRVLDWGAYHSCNPHRTYNTHRFDGGNSFNEPAPFFDYSPVYLDQVPYLDGRMLGYTESDARNEAMARVPTYFRKGDLVRAALPATDGSWVVPSQAQPAPAYWYMRSIGNNASSAPAPATGPATKRGAVIIIPKKLLDRPLNSFEKPSPTVAAAE